MDYSNLDAGARQVVIQNSDHATAIKLCTLDSRHRKICQSLPIEEKTRICLGSGEEARACDAIPMITEQQFKRLVPQTIEVFPDDSLQLRREFYSWKDKLPTEGFTQAFYKAKLMNTIMALVRPDINLTYAAQMPQLPPYVDAALVQLNNDNFRRNLTEGLYKLKLELHDNPQRKYQATIETRFINLSVNEIVVSVKSDDYEELAEIRTAIRLDELIGRQKAAFINKIIIFGKVSYTLSFVGVRNIGESGIPTLLEISRVVKILLDRGFGRLVTLHLATPQGELQLRL